MNFGYDTCSWEGFLEYGFLVRRCHIKEKWCGALSLKVDAKMVIQVYWEFHTGLITRFLSGTKFTSRQDYPYLPFQSYPGVGRNGKFFISCNHFAKWYSFVKGGKMTQGQSWPWMEEKLPALVVCKGFGLWSHLMKSPFNLSHQSIYPLWQNYTLSCVLIYAGPLGYERKFSRIELQRSTFFTNVPHNFYVEEDYWKKKHFSTSFLILEFRLLNLWWKNVRFLDITMFYVWNKNL